jgi:hypothetical protein
MREIWLKNAQHDRSHEGERDIGGYDTHAARESHATTSTPIGS